MIFDKVSMIQDNIKILSLQSEVFENIKKDGEPSREEIIRFLLDYQKQIEEVFCKNEYVKLDLTNGEMVGLKSTAKLGNLEIGDLPALNYLLAHDEKYKYANLLNLGNVKDLYEFYNL